MSEIKLNQYNGEFAALQHQREMESLSRSPFVEAVVGATASGADKLGLPIGGLIRWALKSGQTPLETIIEQIESSAAAAIARHENRLDGHDKELKEFRKALQSQGAQTAYRAAVFHGIRTFDSAKHMRLGTLTINCIYVDDLVPESLDGMMRATVELTEHDINVLGSIYEMQIYLFSPQELQKEYRWRIDAIRSRWEQYWDNQSFSSYQGANGQEFNSSCARLQSVGLIASIGTKTILRGPTMHDYELLPEGKKFCERLQEVAVK
jgi:hypothetical protein